MKKITIHLGKSGRRATCVLCYEYDGGLPISQKWLGDVGDFQLEDGGSMDFNCPQHWLKDVVEFQSAQAEADFTIEDDGGEVTKRRHGELVSDGGEVDVYTATFRKGEHQAACELRYWGGANQPMRNEWTGDEDAYRLPDGNLFKFRFPQETLERELASQAERIGAEFSMTHRIITL